MAEAGICPGDRELWRLQGLLSFPFSHSWSSVVFSDCKPLGNHCILTEHFWRLAQWKWLIQRRLDLPALQGHTLSRSIASQVPHLAAKKKNNVLVILIVSLMTMARIIFLGLLMVVVDHGAKGNDVAQIPTQSLFIKSLFCWSYWHRRTWCVTSASSPSAQHGWWAWSMQGWAWK